MAVKKFVEPEVEPNDFKRKPYLSSSIYRVKKYNLRVKINIGFMTDKGSRTQLKVAVVPA